MVAVGYYSFIVSIILAVYTLFAAIIGERKKSYALIESSRRSLYAILALIILSSAALLHALVTRNFQVEYVASYTSSTLPMFYTVAAFWAGQSGSLLFWLLLLAMGGAVVAWDTRKEFIEKRYIPYTYAVIAFTDIFFLILVLFVTNPFQLLSFIPVDGSGLNPLLQNLGMTYHPPTLFMGYAGYTIPFAYATGALLSGELDSNWVKDMRRWNLYSWLFLTIGIVLGGQWAYEVLGWGGYWAWDPVENSSFIPWLVATAFLHTVMMQERRGMMKFWNMMLAMLAFNLCIFGTFITRTGIISSVHSFGKSTLGPFFTVFMLIVLFAFLYLVYYRKEKLMSDHEIKSFLSRESMFLLAAAILSCICFATTWGTIFPMISELFKGVQITVGPTFFNKITVPQFLILLALMGVCPLISWRKTSKQNLEKNFIIPGIVFIIALVAIIAIYKINFGYALIAYSLCFFVLSIILIEFYRGTKVQSRSSGKNYFVSFFAAIGRNKRKWGGYIVHIGIILTFFGVTGSSAFVREKEIYLKPKESVALDPYIIRYEDLKYEQTPHKDTIIAKMSVFKDNKYLLTLKPEKIFYKTKKEQAATEVAIYSTIEHDLYIILYGYDDQYNASFKVIVNPLVLWMWIGCLVIAFGIVIAFWPNKKRNKAIS